MIFKDFPYLKDADLKEFEQHCINKTYKKGAYLIKQGMISKKVFLLNEGIIRTFYLAADGEENTYCITFPGSFMTAYTSFITQQATIENIQAITDVDVTEISLEAVNAISLTNIRWMRFLKDMAEFQYMELEQRIHQLQNVSAAERYEKLLSDHPEFLLHLPVQYLSSYLGITPRHLNRIRKNLMEI